MKGKYSEKKENGWKPRNTTSSNNAIEEKVIGSRKVMPHATVDDSKQKSPTVARLWLIGTGIVIGAIVMQSYMNVHLTSILSKDFTAAGKDSIVPNEANPVINCELKDESSNTDVPSGDDLRQTKEDEMELTVSTYQEDAKTCDRPKALLFCQNVSSV